MWGWRAWRRFRAGRGWARLAYVWRLLGNRALRDLVTRGDWLHEPVTA